MKGYVWLDNVPEKRLLSGLPGSVVKSLENKIRQGQLLFRMNGTTHLEFKATKDHSLRLMITAGSSQGDPVYASKLRTFLRKLDA